MAKSAAIPLAFAGVATVLVISGIEGESIAETLKGEFGKGTKNPFPSPEEAHLKPEKSPEQQVLNEGQASQYVVPGSLYGHFISPFPKGFQIQWGRSDQGVDGVTPPGTPLLAMGNGTVEWAHDPGGFGSNYPVLHIDNDGAYYYGHSEPLVKGRVHSGEIIARTHESQSWGNSTTPGGFEIGRWPPGGMEVGAQIRSWLTNLPRI